MKIYKPLIRQAVNRLFGTDYLVRLCATDDEIVVYLHNEHYGDTPKESVPIAAFTDDSIHNSNVIVAAIERIEDTLLPF